MAPTLTTRLTLYYLLHVDCLVESSQSFYEAEVICRNTIIILELYKGREAESTYVDHQVETEEKWDILMKETRDKYKQASLPVGLW